MLVAFKLMSHVHNHVSYHPTLYKLNSFLTIKSNMVVSGKNGTHINHIIQSSNAWT